MKMWGILIALLSGCLLYTSFGFMTSSYCSLRELEDNCKVNIRFMYLMDHQTPSYRTFEDVYKRQVPD